MNRIVIVGCGIVGAAIAYELSLVSRLDITVIEKNNYASGATGAALGLLMGVISGKKQGKAWTLRENSLRRYPSLIKELESQTGITIPVNRNGMVKLLLPEDKLDKWQKLQQTRQKQGWNLEIWTIQQLRQKCPQLNNLETIGAVYSPQDTQIHPQILTEALVKAARLNGVKFQFGVSLDSIPTTNPLQQITTSKGTIKFDYLIMAAGLGSTPLTASLSAKLDIRPVLGQATKLQLTEDFYNSEFQPVVTAQDIHLVPLGNKQYWLGATVEFPDELGQVTPNKQLWQKIWQKAIAFYPALTNATILSHWQGKRPRPYGQAAPVIGKLPGYDNILLATAHYRNGVLLAPGTAKEIKALII